MGEDFCFTICLKQIFLGATKFGGTKEIWGHKRNLGAQKKFGGALLPNAPPCLRAWL